MGGKRGGGGTALMTAILRMSALTVSARKTRDENG